MQKGCICVLEVEGMPYSYAKSDDPAEADGEGQRCLAHQRQPFQLKTRVLVPMSVAVQNLDQEAQMHIVPAHHGHFRSAAIASTEMVNSCRYPPAP